MHHKITFQLLILLIFIACSPQSNDTNEEKEPENSLPNIVMIIGDDQGYPYFGFMGADYMVTPNMDSLAASGTLFTAGYVPDNHCRPSLATLMTGMLPRQYNKQVEELITENEIAKDSIPTFKHHAMQYFQTLPKILKEQGYNSFQGGKWWEFHYENGGFTHGMTTGWTAEDRKNGSKWFKQFMGGQGLNLARATMEPVYEFIDQNAEQPFFIWYAPELPHYPFDAPAKYYNVYKDKKMTESAKRYYANCTWFDEGVGELIQYLKDKGEFDHTLFVYVNDNGWEQNPDQEFRHDSLRWHNGGDKGKLSVYDQSYRTPIILSWQGHIPQGVRKTELMHSADIPATLLDYLGIQTPPHYFGRSYKGIIEGQANVHPRNIILGNSNKIRSEADMMGQDVEAYWLRTSEWFFKWNLTLKEVALFDMQSDPRNNHNLAKQNPDLVQKYQTAIEGWKGGTTH